MTKSDHKNSSRKFSTVRASALGSACFAALALSGTVHAQDATSDEGPADARELDTVTVTGSRLQRDNSNAPSPTTGFSAAEFEATGALTAADALAELPQFSNGFGSQSQTINTVNDGFSSGTALANLRNLGTQRTLVLVNGRRHVGGDPGRSSVDLNAIPAEMIDRIDVVTGAASAVYGADAVTGVVNIILKDDFEGAAFTVRSGTTSENDGEELQIAGTIGGGFDDGRGSALLSVEYTQSESIFHRDRSFGQFDGNNYQADGAQGSSAAVGGRWQGETFDASNNLVPFTNDFRFQRTPFRNLQAPVERVLVSAVADYELYASDGFTVNWFNEASFSNSESEITFEPQFFWFRGRNENPTASQFEAPRISATNPFYLASGVTADPSTASLFLRRISEQGDRSSIVNRDTYRFVTGFEGDINDSWRYETYYQYGRVEATQDDVGTLDRNRFFAGLDVNDNGTPTDLSDDTCADPAFVALGCTPINVFGQGTITQDQLNYATIDVLSSAESTQEVFSGFVAGDIFALPAGDVGLVVGAEYREETTTVTPDEALQDRSAATRQVQGVDGSYDVSEVFAEINVPVVADAPFAQLIEFGGAVRYSDYSTVGGETSWSLRGDWTVNDWVRLRGVYATAVRAPNIGELFAPESSFTSALQDPCDTDGGAITLTGNRAANCSTVLGAAAATFDQSQQDSQVTRQLTSGNANLDAEDATTFTVGAVFTPISGLTVEVDYWDVEIEDVIRPFNAQTILNQCFDQPGLPTEFCAAVNRDPNTNQIADVTAFVVNAATENAEGLDIAVRYFFDLESAGVPGDFGVSLNYSHLFDRSFIAFDGADEEDRTGEIGNFEDQFSAQLNYNIGDFGLGWNLRYLSDALGNSVDPVALALDGNSIDSIVYNDLQARYSLGDSLDLSFGIENVFDEDPPLITDESPLVGGAEITAGGIYDTRGRFFYASVSKRF
ncbi:MULTISPECIES: TonB-dependent receptor domain-containing protein [Hyphomonas]|uniref:TonB-dependent receptor domain-containing protein n=1 Tax=Hyphomonas TaxID=85 RepID=UPI000C3C85B2|nr:MULTISPECIES: TonB-dependent receptor [Hyphomonas]MBB38453.1 hypothetical protein [Hyphomonas sp.]